jgi:iron-sulfur cluster assembly protein
MNIKITPHAESYIRRMIRFNGGTSGSGLRLLVTPGGCSGLNSSFTVEAAPLDGDEVMESNGVKIFLPAESRIMLAGVTVDFTDNAMSTGLSFIIPNAQSCACSSTEFGMPPKPVSVSADSIQRRH